MVLLLKKFMANIDRKSFISYIVIVREIRIFCTYMHIHKKIFEKEVGYEGKY